MRAWYLTCKEWQSKQRYRDFAQSQRYLETECFFSASEVTHCDTGGAGPDGTKCERGQMHVGPVR
jgi:hypothetical protein